LRSKADAWVLLGEMHLRGVGVAKDLYVAKQYFRKACEQRSSMWAQTGGNYGLGIIAEKSGQIAKAVKHLGKTLDLKKFSLVHEARAIVMKALLEANKNLKKFCYDLMNQTPALRIEELQRADAFFKKTALTFCSDEEAAVARNHIADCIACIVYGMQKSYDLDLGLGGKIDDKLLDILRYDQHPEIVKQYGITVPKAVLMYGPPGSGKTTLAEALCKKLKAKYILINGPDVFPDKTEIIRTRFAEAADCAKKGEKAVIFIDEIDTVGRNRQAEGGDKTAPVVNTLLIEMDKVKEDEEILILANTNRPDTLDSALRRRFDRSIQVDFLDEQSRHKILKRFLKKLPFLKPFEKDPVLAKLYNSLAANTEGWTVAYLKKIGPACADLLEKQFRETIEWVSINDIKGCFIEAFRQIQDEYFRNSQFDWINELLLKQMMSSDNARSLAEKLSRMTEKLSAEALKNIVALVPASGSGDVLSESVKAKIGEERKKFEEQKQNIGKTW
jgi:adenylate kinase family enzyme